MRAGFLRAKYRLTRAYQKRRRNINEDVNVGVDQDENPQVGVDQDENPQVGVDQIENPQDEARAKLHARQASLQTSRRNTANPRRQKAMDQTFAETERIFNGNWPALQKPALGTSEAKKVVRTMLSKRLKETTSVAPGEDPLHAVQHMVQVAKVLGADTSESDRVSICESMLDPDTVNAARSCMISTEAMTLHNFMRGYALSRGMRQSELDGLLFSSKAERMRGESAEAHRDRFCSLAALSSTVPETTLVGQYLRCASVNSAWSQSDLEREGSLFNLERATPKAGLSVQMWSQLVAKLDREFQMRPGTDVSKLSAQVFAVLHKKGIQVQQGTGCKECGSFNHRTREHQDVQQNGMGARYLQKAHDKKRREEKAPRCDICWRTHAGKCFFSPGQDERRERFRTDNGQVFSANPAHRARYNATIVPEGETWSETMRRLKQSKVNVREGKNRDRRGKRERTEEGNSASGNDRTRATVLSVVEEVFAQRFPKAAKTSDDEGNKNPDDSECLVVGEDGVIMHSRAGAPCGVPVVPVTINGQQSVHASMRDFPQARMVDSGASHSCVSSSQLTDNELLHLQPSSIQNARGFDGGSARVIGEITLDISISDQSAKVSFLVIPDLDVPLILGINAIEALKIVIDGEKGHVRVGRNAWPLPSKNETLWRDAVISTLNTSGRVGLKAGYDITIPARSSVILALEGSSSGLPAGSSIGVLTGPIRSSLDEPLAVPVVQDLGDCSELPSRGSSTVWAARSETIADIVTIKGRNRLFVKTTFTNTGLKDQFIRAGTKVAQVDGLRSDFATVTRIAIGEDNLTVNDLTGWSEADRRAYASATDVSPPGPDDLSKERLLQGIETAVEDAGASGLSEQQCGALRQILLRRVLPLGYDPTDPAVQAAKVEPVKIRMKPDAEPSMAPRRVTTVAGEKFKVETEEGFLRMGVVEKCEWSEWASAVHLARKKNGDFRYCIDMRALNKAVMKHAYPLPACQDLLDTLHGAKYFTTLDAKSGYWQFPLDEESRPYTAFRSVRHGLLQWRRLPMGLVVSSAEFQKRIELILSGLTWTECLCYVDDVIIFSKSWEEHMKALDKVLQRLGEARVTINLAKSYFCRTSVSYLGFRVSAAGVAPDDALVEKIKATMGPLNYTQAQAFLGQTVLYRRYVYRYGDVCQPVREAVRAATSPKQKEIAGEFVWTTECQSAMTQLQEILATKPVHQLPDPQRPYFMFTDASGYAFGCVLCQRDEDGEFHSVLYDSIAFPSKTRAWHTTEKEAFAVVHFTHKYAHYIDNGLPFTVFTDHTAVSAALANPKGNSKLLRWGLSLAPFVDKMFIRHWSGKRMPADFLSRHPMWLKDPDTEKPGGLFQLQFAPVLVNDTVDSGGASFFSLFVDEQNADEEESISWVPAVLASLQKDCDEIGLLYRATAGESDAQKECQYWKKHSGFVIDERGVLWKSSSNNPREQVVPKGLRHLLLSAFHDSPLAGHVKGQKLLRKFVGKFWWPNRDHEVGEWHKTCEACQAFARPRHAPYGENHSLPALEPFSITAMDLVGPLPMTFNGNRYVLVWTDYLTRWVEAVPIPNKSASVVAKAFVAHILCRWGAPLRLLSDRGKEFANKVLRSVLKTIGTEHLLTAPYRPQADGMTERLNGTLIAKISKFVRFDQRDWDTYVPFATFAYNSECHSVTRVSPFQAMTGMEPRLPLEAALLERGTRGTLKDISMLRDAFRDRARSNDQERIEKSKAANASRLKSPFVVGDLVRRRVHALNRERNTKANSVGKRIQRTQKLARRFSQPMRIIKQEGDRYTLGALNSESRTSHAHAADLEYYRLPCLTRRYVSGADLDEWYRGGTLRHGEEVIDAIVDHRDDPSGRMYKVAWEGVDEKYSHSWEPLESFGLDNPNVVEYERSLLRGVRSHESQIENVVRDYIDPILKAHKMSGFRSEGSKDGLGPAAPDAPGEPMSRVTERADDANDFGPLPVGEPVSATPGLSITAKARRSRDLSRLARDEPEFSSERKALIKPTSEEGTPNRVVTRVIKPLKKKKKESGNREAPAKKQKKSRGHSVRTNGSKLNLG